MPRRTATIESDEEEVEVRPSRGQKAGQKRGRAEVKKRGIQEEDDEEDEEEEEEDEEEDEDTPRRKSRGTKAKDKGNKSKGKEKEKDADADAGKKKKGGGATQELDDQARNGKAIQLARLALFNEISRKATRRDDKHVKTILGDHTRSFPNILPIAQKRLRNILGMELVETRPRASEGAGLPATQKGKKKKDKEEEEDDGDGPKSKKGGGGGKAYVLRSKFPMEVLRKAMEEFGEEEGGKPLRVIDWEESDEIGLMGVLHVILGLILVNGKRVRDDQLHSYLKRLSLLPDSPIPASSLHPSTFGTTLDTYLGTLQRQGYIERHKAPASGGGDDGGEHDGGGRGGGGGGGRAGGSSAYEYLWGTRAEIEIGEKAVAEFIADIYLDKDAEPEEDEEDEEGGGGGGEGSGVRRSKAKGLDGRQAGEAGRQKLLREIARAAGAKDETELADAIGTKKG